MKHAWRDWEEAVKEQKPAKASMEELQAAKQAALKGSGQRPSTAIQEICRKVMGMPPEEPLKFSFTFQDQAERFRMALHRHYTNCGMPLISNRCNTTVYIYKEDK